MLHPTNIRVGLNLPNLFLRMMDIMQGSFPCFDN